MAKDSGREQDHRFFLATDLDKSLGVLWLGVVILFLFLTTILGLSAELEQPAEEPDQTSLVTIPESPGRSRQGELASGGDSETNAIDLGVVPRSPSPRPE